MTKLNTQLILRFSSLVGLLFLTIACVTSSKKLTEISIGMTKPQVITILGEPKSVSGRNDGTELLRYQLSGRSAPIGNPNGRQFADGYTIQFFQDKVVAYGRDDEFKAVDVRIRKD
jgi:hypothetical protein